MLWGLFSKPIIPQDLRNALEESGPEIVRTILLHGWANRQDLPEVLQQIAVQSSEQRKAAFAWLKWKDAVQVSWMKGGIIAAVLAAVFSFVSLLK
jgi:hypothetical protein